MSDSTDSIASWCDDMTAWMNERLIAGQIAGPMMWGSPAQMLATCRTWASVASLPSPTWCDNMVGWMRQHMNGNWNDWMMDGPMMGN